MQILDTVQALAASSSFDPYEFNEQVSKLLNKVDIQASFEGFSPDSEYAKALRKDYLSRAHASRIGYLMQVNPSAASGYLDAVEGQINQKITAPLREALRPLVEEQEIESAVNEVFSEAPSATRDELIASARQKFHGRPWLSKAEAGIRRLHADREAGDRERIEEAEKNVFSYLAKAQMEGKVPTRADVPPQVWANLAIAAPERVVAITDSLRGKTETGPGSSNQLTTWGLLKTDPEALVKTNLDTLLVEGKISKSHYKDLITDQVAIRNGQGEKESTILTNKAAVDTVLKGVGITQSKNPARYAKFYEAMNQRMKAFEVENSKPPKQEEITTMARGLLSEVSQDVNWWPIDKDVRAFEADLEKIRVPEQDQAAIAQKLEARGIPVTDDTVRAVYLERKIREETR